MEENTKAIVELAWSRVLGLPDDALTSAAPGDRVTRVDHSMIMFVTLWDHEVLVGPPHVLDAAAGLHHRELRDGASLLALGADPAGGPHSGRLLGEAVLGFTDSYVVGEELKSTGVSDDPAAVADLERLCPPDDIAEVGLSTMTWKFAMLDDTDELLAGAGFEEWEQILGHVGVLTPPARRRTGHGAVAAGIATNEALDRGLVPQWRARADNVASRRVARRLGYSWVGSQTTVLFVA